MKHHYVYSLQNTMNGRRYIGVRSCDCAPIDDHRYLSSSRYVIADVKQHGASIFLKEILSIFPSREQAVAEEIRLHAELSVDTDDNYYNRSKQKTNRFDTSSLVGAKNHFFGRKHSEATKQKLRESNTGKPGYWRDHPIREDVKAKLREHNLGKRASDATKAKMRSSHLGLFAGEKHPLYGTKSTALANVKRRIALAGKPKSPEMRAKLRATQRSRPCGFSGRKHSPETIERIRASVRARLSKNLQTEPLGSAGGSSTAVRTSDA